MSACIIQQNVLLYLREDISEFIVPEDVIRISDNALFHCSNLEVLTITNPNTLINGVATSNCLKLNKLILGDITYNVVVADGDTLIIDNKRDMGDITLYKCRSIRQIMNGNILSYSCNLASRNGYFAHGETAKEAIRDVNLKISYDALKVKPIYLDEIMTPERYREITGACDLGVKRFIEEHNLVEGIRLSELIPILEASNSYGVDKILSLIKENL